MCPVISVQEVALAIAVSTVPHYLPSSRRVFPPQCSQAGCQESSGKERHLQQASARLKLDDD